MKSTCSVLFVVVTSSLVGVSGCSKNDSPAPGAVQQLPESKPARVDVSFEKLKEDYDAANRKYREEVFKEAKAKSQAFQEELQAAGKAVKDAKNDEEMDAGDKSSRRGGVKISNG